MRIKLIYPNNPEINIIQMRIFWYPLLAFPVLAGCTPDEHEVDIIDEVFESIAYDEPVDLVGITAMTFLAPRAYEIADAYRRRGITVVMGGIHASTLPREAQQHVDAIVIGEAESVWAELLADVKDNRLKPLYKANSPFDMTQYPRPKLELLKKYFLPGKQYYPYGYNSLNVLEFSRGCPFDCDFCCVTNYFGKSYRSRPTDDVVRYMRGLKLGFRDRTFNFNDDNIYGNRQLFVQLLEKLPKLNIRWTAQVSINVAKDKEIMGLIANSGCMALFVGFESLSDESLKSVNKKANKVKDYHSFMEACEKLKIRVVGSIIFGLDGDDETSFKNTVEFVTQYEGLTPSYTILTPFPGTRLYERMKAENRIIDFDWAHYDEGHVVYKPKHMTEQVLMDGYIWAMSQSARYQKSIDQISQDTKKLSVQLRSEKKPGIK